MHVNCIGTVISKYSDIVVYIRTCNYKTSTCNNCTNQFSYKAGQQMSSVLSVFSVLIFRLPVLPLYSTRKQHLMPETTRSPSQVERGSTRSALFCGEYGYSMCTLLAHLQEKWLHGVVTN